VEPCAQHSVKSSYFTALHEAQAQGYPTQNRAEKTSSAYFALFPAVSSGIERTMECGVRGGGSPKKDLCQKAAAVGGSQREKNSGLGVLGIT
jgi:hypothetical protein